MFHLIEPDLGRVSGGLRYNRQLTDAAAGLIIRHRLAGNWPKPSAQDIATLQELLAACDGPLLLDGLIGCALDQPLPSDQPVVLLVHALAETVQAQAREAACLRAADAVIATSRYAASCLEQRYSIPVAVAIPGVKARPLATGGDGGTLICVGAIEPNKNQIFLARVLAQLQTAAPWRCIFAGPVTDSAYGRALEHALQDVPAERVLLAGELDAAGIADLYDQADLLLLPSKAETFGLVVREANAAGIPAIVTAGTGAEEALSAGATLPLDVSAWAQALTRWLTEPQHRHEAQAAARQARQRPNSGWDSTAATVLEVLERVAQKPKSR